MLPVGHEVAHRPQPIHFSVVTWNGLSVIMCFAKKPPIIRLLIFGHRPIVSSSMFFCFSIISRVNRSRSAAALSFFCFSFSGVSTSINGSPTYDSGMISENALSRCMFFDARSLFKMSMVSPIVSPAVHSAKQ